jgi:hypothetical protein
MWLFLSLTIDAQWMESIRPDLIKRARQAFRDQDIELLMQHPVNAVLFSHTVVMIHHDTLPLFVFQYMPGFVDGFP